MKNMPLAATSSNTSVLAIGQKDCMTPTITSSVCRENFEETIPASKFVDQNAGLQEQLTNTKVRDVCQSVKVEASLRNNSNHTVNLSRNGFKSLFGVAASVEKGRANGNNILKRKADVHTVHFRFNQGYSNAVRRTVTINDFL